MLINGDGGGDCYIMNSRLILKISFIILLYIFFISMMGYYGDPDGSWTRSMDVSSLIQLNNSIFKNSAWIIVDMVMFVFILLRLSKSKKADEPTQVNGKMDKRPIIVESIRFALVNLLWLLIINGFIFTSQIYGHCHDIPTSGLYHNFWTCKASNGNWKGFKVSGHVFVSVLGIILLIEEMLILHRIKHDGLWKNILGVIVIGWLLMVLTITGLFYHSITEKMLGATLSLALWLVLCRLFDRNNCKIIGRAL